MGYDAVVQLVVPEVLKAHVPSNHWELLIQKHSIIFQKTRTLKMLLILIFEGKPGKYLNSTNYQVKH